MRIRDYGYKIGTIQTGMRNKITDVPGVKVGHCTIDYEDNHTGVTVVLPCKENIYKERPVAAVYTLNGYGKTIGTIQIEELGILETPIALTNTLNAGKVADALIEYTLLRGKEEGMDIVSVNPVVGETNDSKINVITKRVVEEKHVFQAIQSANEEFEEGAVGAGRGTVCFGLKGGIGSASRIMRFGGKEYTLGILVQSNYGVMSNLIVNGDDIGKKIAEKIRTSSETDKGSIMVVMATDIPLSERQLKRVLKRATIGIVRTGSFMGHGSGDVFIGFSTGNCLKEQYLQKLNHIDVIPENHLDRVFQMCAEATEEAVLNSMVCADGMYGIKNQYYHSLQEFL